MFWSSIHKKNQIKELDDYVIIKRHSQAPNY